MKRKEPDSLEMLAMLAQVLKKSPELMDQVRKSAGKSASQRKILFEEMASSMERDGLPKPLATAVRLLGDDKIFKLIEKELPADL